jgi:TRAP-type C4-dicarboxylate transport system permease small subunit
VWLDRRYSRIVAQRIASLLKARGFQQIETLLKLNPWWNTTDNVPMDTDYGYLLAAAALLLFAILYIMRRRVRLGRKKGTF